MTEKIKEIVDQFLVDWNDDQNTYKYRLNHCYYVKFENTLRSDFVRIYFGVELPGYEFVRSDVYKFSSYRLSNDDEGLAALIEMIYKEVENMNSENVSIGYNFYKSVLIDNDKLREENKFLEKSNKHWKDLYFQERTEHTKTKARIVFGQHILSGNREEKVKEFWENNKEYVDMYRSNENQY